MISLDDFIVQYDRPGAVILMEGKRKVAESDSHKLVAFGTLLATKTRNVLFRNGNAPGADQLFAQGISCIDPSWIQSVVPYEGHRNKMNIAKEIFVLDEIPLTRYTEIITLSRRNQKTAKLIDPYLQGYRDRYSSKAAYILRDTLKVIGAGPILAATFGIFYDDLHKPQTGGTGHTIDICHMKNIPFINQQVWETWLE